jgi:hypothetical protein
VSKQRQGAKCQWGRHQSGNQYDKYLFYGENLPEADYIRAGGALKPASYLIFA